MRMLWLLLLRLLRRSLTVATKGASLKGWKVEIKGVSAQLLSWNVGGRIEEVGVGGSGIYCELLAPTEGH